MGKIWPPSLKPRPHCTDTLAAATHSLQKSHLTRRLFCPDTELAAAPQDVGPIDPTPPSRPRSRRSPQQSQGPLEPFGELTDTGGRKVAQGIDDEVLLLPSWLVRGVRGIADKVYVEVTIRFALVFWSFRSQSMSSYTSSFLVHMC
jgi:hypothetical protein